MIRHFTFDISDIMPMAIEVATGMKNAIYTAEDYVGHFLTHYPDNVKPPFNYDDKVDQYTFDSFYEELRLSLTNKLEGYRIHGNIGYYDIVDNILYITTEVDY
nr:MAG TPA: hypothetical protein [Caudoviricetes sp.]